MEDLNDDQNINNSAYADEMVNTGNHSHVEIDVATPSNLVN
jgi:hypothetical protein